MRIGVDLGGTKTEAIVMDDAGQIVLRERRPTPAAAGYQAILRNVADLVAGLERQAEAACRVGIGTPGAVSLRTGLMKNSNTTCLNGRPLFADMQNLLDRPLRMANDANCFALSEARDGAGTGCDIVFGVIMGTGVGGGIVCHGQLHEGLQHIGGEWGHTPLEAEGPACYCGHRGCVETLLSGPGLVRDYQAQGGDLSINAREIVALAAHGDELAEEAMQRFLEHFGRALATVINILDPHVIVLGGGLSNIERLYSEGRERVAQHVFNDELRTPIVKNAHGDSSGVRGAAQLWQVGEAI